MRIRRTGPSKRSGHAKSAHGKAGIVACSLSLVLLATACSAAVTANGSSSVASAAATPKSSPSSPTDPAVALQQDFIRVVKSVRQSVVEIATSSGLGSGVIYDARGDIVTNAHVIGNATSFTVTLASGTRLAGRLIGTFVPDDLAVLRVQSPKKLAPAKFANSSSLQVGSIVLAIGSPLGLSSSVTDGIVSFNGRTLSEGNGVVLTGLIQTSAAINPGNSGGALANISGEVVGIPTLAASSGGATAPGLGFAIPANTIKLIVSQIIAHGKVTTAGRATLGLSGATALTFTGEPVGVIVTSIQPNGPAARGGIAVGELITAINGKPTATLEALESILANLKPGTRATVAVTRSNGNKRTVAVRLGDLAQG